MLTLSSAIILEKNKIATEGAWLVLLKIEFPLAETLYLAHNNEDVDWDSQTWMAFPFQVDTISEDSKGTLPTYSIKVANIGGMLTKLVDENDGGNGATTTLYVVHSEHLAELTPVFEDTAIVVSCSIGNEWVSFTLGAESPMHIRSPKQRYLQNHCRYKDFKGALCGYAGAVGSCDRTMKTCDNLGNLARFGGFPGIGLNQGVYV